MADVSLQFCFVFLGLAGLRCATGKIQHKIFMLSVELYFCNINKTSGFPLGCGKISRKSLQTQKVENSKKKICATCAHTLLSNDRKVSLAEVLVCSDFYDLGCFL